MIAWFIPKVANAEEVLVPAVVKLMKSLNQHIFNPIIIALFAIALLVFAFGIIEFFFAKQTGEGLEQGRQHVLWGLVGMAVMGGVFGIMHLIVNILGVTYFK